MRRTVRLNEKGNSGKEEERQGRTNIGPITTFFRQKQLRWYGHVLRKEGEDTTKKMLTMQVQCKRRRERPKKRWLYNIREDMKESND